MKREHLTELLYQGLETEMGGTRVYETALRCVQNEELKEEWEEYLEQTKTHVQVMLGVFNAFGLDSEAETPGRLVLRHIGESLVKAMELALQAGSPEAAELVACECVVEAGWMISDLASPTLASRLKIWTLSISRRPASTPPFSSNAMIAP